MFCSDCGKTIEDDALICPKCGAVTKNGILALKKQETSNQENDTAETSSNLDLSIEKKSKNQKITAMILGLAGSAILLLSLLSEFSSLSAPIIGTVSVSMSDHLDKLIFLVIALAGLSILSSLLKYSVLQIVSGTITAGWAGYMIWKIQNATSNTEYSGLVSVKIGIGVYLFILAACLILASGIVYAVATKKNNATTIKKGFIKPKKSEIILCICLGALIICGIIGLIVIKNQGKKEAKTAVSEFMNAAILYDVSAMKSYLSTDINDKNGFMEAYTPKIMSDAFVSSMGIKTSDLEKEKQEAINETSILFGKNYLKQYNVSSVSKNSDGSFTVKVSASIIDMSATDEQIQKKTSELISDYAKQHPDVMSYVRTMFWTEEDVAFFMTYFLFEDVCKVMNDAIKSAGSMDTEFTFVVVDIDGNYMITEIDYTD